MKTSLYRQNRTPFFGVTILVVLIAGVIFSIDRLGGGIVRIYARGAGSVVYMSAAGAAHFLTDNGFLTTKRALVAENSALKEMIAEYAERASYIGAIQKENEDLRALVHLAADHPHGITARVISSFTASPYGTFVIDAGSSDGVVEGSVVLTAGGYVLGRVASVSASSATVRAVFAPGAEIDVIDGEIAMRAMGKGGGNAVAEVPRDSSVVINDAVTAPFFGGKSVGVIGRIDAASSSATQTLYLRIPVNLDTLRFVYVIP